MFAGYHHKKFDHNKRISEESYGSANMEDVVTSSNSTTKIEHESIYSPSIVSNSDSSCSTEFGGFVANLNQTSTPVKERKRRFLRSYHTQNTQADSGVYCQGETSSKRFKSTLVKQRGVTAACTPPPPTPIADILPRISNETLRNICKYHGNMVRKFPKKERSPKDQERRNKNTVACRMSRRFKKLEHITVEEQYKEFSQKYSHIIEESIRASAYLNELMRLEAVVHDEHNRARKYNGLMNLDHAQEERGAVQDPFPSTSKLSQLAAAAAEMQKRPFSVAFLTGRDEQ